MAFKFFAIACLFVVAASAFEQELSCTLAGGLCMMEKDCPHPVTDAVKGMCPQQAALGAVCCDKPMPDHCASGAGECSADCPPTIRNLAHQDECPTGQYCCVWRRENIKKEEQMPKHCAYGAGECNANCPPAIRNYAHQDECPSGEYCCVWTRNMNKVEEEMPARCAFGAGECNANCPPSIRNFAHQNECPAGQYCCIWL